MRSIAPQPRGERKPGSTPGAAFTYKLARKERKLYEIVQTARGFKVRKPYTYKNGRPDSWLYLESRYKGVEKWTLDYLYARTYTKAGANRIIKALERR